MVKSKERKLRPHGPDLAEHLVILKVNLGIQAKAFADGPDGGRFRRERVGHILPGGKVVGFVGEFAAAGVFRAVMSAPSSFIAAATALINSSTGVSVPFMLNTIRAS